MFDDDENMPNFNLLILYIVKSLRISRFTPMDHMYA